MEAPPVTVEVHLGNGLPAFNIVGLPEAEVREARDRVRAALNHGQFEFPARRITVNLAPSGQLPSKALDGQEFAGELSLTGELRPVRGALALALGSEKSARAIVLPAPNAAQAALAPRSRVLPAKSLLEVCAH